MTLAPKRLQLVQVARKRLALEDSDYRAILLQYGGCASGKSLDARGFEAVMDRFRQLGFTSTARAKSFGERENMASPGQVALIQMLWSEAVDDPTEAHLNTFLERRFGVSALRFLPRQKAGGVITALKFMAARRKAARGASASQAAPV